MTNRLAIWQCELDPTPFRDNPHVRPSALMAVADKLKAVANMLGTLDTAQTEYGLAVANMAAAYGLAALAAFGVVDGEEPVPPILNLQMAHLAMRNLLANVEFQIELLRDRGRQEDAQRNTAPIAPPPSGGLVIDRPQPKEGKIAIVRWADLGIGIDVGKYHAFSPCPELGQRVRLKDATILLLVGDRWPKVLECLARSRDGKTAAKAELVQKLHPIKSGEISEEQAVFDEGMREKAKNALTTLKNTMADLGRELRGFVTTADPTTVFKINGDDYMAAFTTRHLLCDDDGNYSFGSAK